MGDSRSILIDLDITADLFKEPEEFQSQCLDAADRLASILRGNEIPADRLCREMIKAAAAKHSPPSEEVKALKHLVSGLINDESATLINRFDDWTNEELAQIHQVLIDLSHSVENDLNERLLNQDGGQIIRSKRMASYLYQRLRVFHDKWRKAQAMFDSEKKWAVINGMPGNFKDNSGPMFIYMFRNEEYTFHHHILRTLRKEAESNAEVGNHEESLLVDLEAIKTVADFHEFVQANPECGVVIHEVP